MHWQQEWKCYKTVNKREWWMGLHWDGGRDEHGRGTGGVLSPPAWALYWWTAGEGGAPLIQVTKLKLKSIPSTDCETCSAGDPWRGRAGGGGKTTTNGPATCFINSVLLHMATPTSWSAIAHSHAHLLKCYCIQPRPSPPMLPALLSC